MNFAQTDIEPNDLPPLPDAAVALARTETFAVERIRAAAGEEVEQIKADIHDRTGTLASSVAASVRRTPGGGVYVRFGAIRKVDFTTRKGSRIVRELYGGEGGKRKKQKAFQADFVDRGTGIAGPLGRRIQRPGLIPTGQGYREPSGVGQRPQRMFQRARDRWESEKLPRLDGQIEARLTLEIEGRR